MSSTPTSTTPTAPPAEPQAGLGLWDAVSIIVGIVIGTSIFKVPWLIFMNVSDPWMGLAVWVLCGILALIGALCYAELASTYPKSGGDYFYLTRSMGPWMGFLFGWTQLAVVFTASIAAMAIVFGEFATKVPALDISKEPWYLSIHDSIGLSPDAFLAAVAVIVVTFFNILGVTSGKWLQNLLTIAKVIGVLLILVAGFFFATESPGSWSDCPCITIQEGKPWTHSIGVLAWILVLYAYGGWNDAAFVASEVRNPQRNIPRALIYGVGLITLVYLLINLAYIMGLGWDNVNKFNPEPVPSRVVEHAFEGWGGLFMSVLIMISALGAVNGLVFTGARVYASLGNDYPLFGWLGHWKEGKGAPILALIFQLLFTLAMIWCLATKQGHEMINSLFSSIGIDHEPDWKPGQAFETLVSHTAPVFWFFFMLTGISLFLLRDKNPNQVRPFSVPCYPWLPIIFVNTCVFMLYQASMYVGWRALFAFGIAALGIPLYFLARLVGYRGTTN